MVGRLGRASNGAPAANEQPDEDTEDVGVDEPADPAEVGDLVERFQELLDQRRPPDGPVTEPWSMGVGAVFAAHPKVPKAVRGLVTRLDRFGGVRITPEEITFDGDDVSWSKVTEVRRRHVLDYLLGDAVRRQIQTIPLPPFPGRRRLLDAFGQAVLTLAIATAKDKAELLDAELWIPAELEYKAALGRRKELGAGVVAALVVLDPAVSRAVVETAQARGVPVRVHGEETVTSAAQRAAAVREKIAALEAELDRLRRFRRED